MLDCGATPEGRAEIAAQSQISEKLIASWVSAVDLTRVTGVGPQSAEPLEAAGVASVADLAQQDAASLHEKLVAVNASRNLVRVVPGVSQIEKAIETAKELPQVVTFYALASYSLPDAFEPSPVGGRKVSGSEEK